MGNHATIDTETVPNSRALHYLETVEFKPVPKTLKDPAKIEASITEQRQAMVEKFALHWTFCQVICLSVVTDDDPPQCWYGEDESKILIAFGEFLKTRPWTVLCGAYTKSFDIPMLCGRYMAHSLGVPDQLRLVEAHKLQDVMQIFGFSDHSQQRCSLNQMAHGLDIPAKLGHGGDVSGWYNAAQLGDASAWDKLSRYCIQDSLIAHEALARFKKTFGATPMEASIIAPPF